MQSYEYLGVYYDPYEGKWCSEVDYKPIPDLTGAVMDVMNHHAEDGWRVIQILTVQGSSHTYTKIYFERPLTGMRRA